MLEAIRRGSRAALAEMKGNAEAWDIGIRMDLQELLQAQGFYQGRIDGVYGPGTLRALDAGGRRLTAAGGERCRLATPRRPAPWAATKALRNGALASTMAFVSTSGALMRVSTTLGAAVAAAALGCAPALAQVDPYLYAPSSTPSFGAELFRRPLCRPHPRHLGRRPQELIRPARSTAKASAP